MKILDLKFFRSISHLTLVPRQNNPYSSSESNKCGIVNYRQIGGEKLKYVLKFCISRDIAHA